VREGKKKTSSESQKPSIEAEVFEIKLEISTYYEPYLLVS